jgi:hypothetical protein
MSLFALNNHRVAGHLHEPDAVLTGKNDAKDRLLLPAIVGTMQRHVSPRGVLSIEGLRVRVKLLGSERFQTDLSSPTITLSRMLPELGPSAITVISADSPSSPTRNEAARKPPEPVSCQPGGAS